MHSRLMNSTSKFQHYNFYFFPEPVIYNREGYSQHHKNLNWGEAQMSILNLYVIILLIY